jgi:hypothetical protein
MNVAMIPPTCPRCHQVITAADINVAADVAFCRHCNLASKLSPMVHAHRALDVGPFDADAAPHGAWAQMGPGEAILGASHRSPASAAGLLAISIFWNGIVSVFVLVALASSLTLAGIPIPDWFPAPTMNEKPMGLGITLFLWIFLTPFILVGLGMLLGFVNALCGRTILRLSHGHATVFSGIGPIGWTQRFQPGEVREVRLEDRQWRDSDGDARRRSQGVFVLESGREVAFGGSLPAARLRYLVAGAKAGIAAVRQ